MRVRALAILVLLLTAVFPAAAQAHASLLRTDPAAGSVVARAPGQVVLHFDQQVEDRCPSLEPDVAWPSTIARPTATSSRG